MARFAGMGYRPVGRSSAYFGLSRSRSGIAGRPGPTTVQGRLTRSARRRFRLVSSNENDLFACREGFALAGSARWLPAGKRKWVARLEPRRPPRRGGVADPRAKPAPNPAAACRCCHSDATLAMKKAGTSLPLFVDAEVAAKSAHRSLACLDCHQPFAGERSPHHQPMVAVDRASCHVDTAKNVAQQVCGNCPASRRLTQQYGRSSPSFRTFSDSSHGLAVRGGGVEVVTCASCHSPRAISAAGPARPPTFGCRRYGSRCTRDQRRAPRPDA